MCPCFCMSNLNILYSDIAGGGAGGIPYSRFHKSLLKFHGHANCAKINSPSFELLEH